MTTIYDYIGRHIDVAAFQGTSPRGEVLLRQSFADAGEGGRAVTGIIKLGQRFLLEFLTEQGSMVHQDGRGSTFITEARAGLINTQADLFAAASRGIIDAGINLQADETDDDPADERFFSAELTGVELSRGDAKLYITLRSRDPAAVAILPIEMSFSR